MIAHMTKSNERECRRGYYRQLGLIPYAQCLELQRTLQKRRIDTEIEDTILLCEHPPVITIGKSGQMAHLLAPQEQLTHWSIDLHRIERGGDITAHNPGQAVLYPIVNIDHLGLCVPEFVSRLEAVIIATLDDFGIEANRRPGFPGVWSGPRKIASIGLHLSHKVSMHGLAINVCNDLSLFDLFIPCGIHGCTMTSMQQSLERNIPVMSVFQHLVFHFGQFFTMHLIPD